MPPSLLSFFIFNKQGTKIGVWTWRSVFGAIILIVVSNILRSYGVEINDNLGMTFLVINNLSIVLNRFDKSGPLTVDEATPLAKSMRSPLWHKDINGN